MSQFERADDGYAPPPAPWGEAPAAGGRGGRVVVEPGSSLLEGLGLVALVAIMGVAAVALGLVLAVNQLDNEGLAFANRAADAVTLRWDESALLTRATPALAAQASSRLDPMFAALRVSAAYAANQGCKGRAGIGFRGFQDPLITAAYDCPLATRGRDLDVNLRLRKTDGAWKIDGFTVERPPAG